MLKITEHQHQCVVMQWTDAQGNLIPELKLLFAVPNGGKRNIVVAKKLKAEGVKAGVPDLFLPVPRNGKHGLFIEMKTQGGKTSPNQKEWLSALKAQGYATCVCYSADEAINAIKRYLGL